MVISELRFEWDDDKSIQNYRKHGILFVDAALVFTDPLRVEIYDTAHSDTEDRFITIGLVDKVLHVVYTVRGTDGEIIRLISARPATKKEREAYYGHDTSSAQRK